MDAEFAKKWVADLRDPANKQCKTVLHDEGGGYCCLGRAEVLAGSEFILDEDVGYGIRITVEGDEKIGFETQDLTHDTQIKIGMDSVSGRRRDRQPLHFGPKYGPYNCLATANDGGVPFHVLADYIEANHAEL